MSDDTKPEDDEIDDGTYHLTQQQLQLLAGMVRDMPLAKMLERIERAKTVAPLFNPSLYMRAAAKLDLVEKLVRGGLAFQKMIPTEEELQAAQREQDAVERMQGVRGRGDLLEIPGQDEPRWRR